MQVIPVIDLMSGQVVHAQGGRRDAYRPIATPLCVGSTPADVVAGLLRVHPFARLYVADLDAIAGQGEHAAALSAIAARWPRLQAWVDRGTGDLDAARAWLARGAGHLVIGSESQRDAAIARALAGEARVLLSLDFRGEQFLGPAALLEDTAAWPARVHRNDAGPRRRRRRSGPCPRARRRATCRRPRGLRRRRRPRCAGFAGIGRGGGGRRAGRDRPALGRDRGGRSGERTKTKRPPPRSATAATAVPLTAVRRWPGRTASRPPAARPPRRLGPCRPGSSPCRRARRRTRWRPSPRW